MPAKTKKNINDDDFFDGGEPIDLIDPDAGMEAEVDDAPVDTDDTVDEPVVDDDAPVDDDSDANVVADVEGGWTDPQPHLPDDPVVLKTTIAEIRKLANQTSRENQELSKQLDELRAQNQVLEEFDYGVDEPSYDGQAFTHMAAQDARSAFEYAFQAGNDVDARTAIAQVQIDAQELSALAAIAHREGDQDAYANLRNQAQNAAVLARDFDSRLAQKQQATANAPLVADQRARAAQQAEEAYNRETGGEYANLRAQTLQVLQANPHLIKGYGVEDMQAGLRIAHAVAKAQPAPVSVAATIDEQVAAAVKTALEATRAAKAKAADAASGADGGRSAPASTAAQSGIKEAAYETQSAGQRGARAFMDL